MNLKQIAFFVAGLTTVGSSVAIAAEESKGKPVTSWTCADFLAVDDQFKPKVIYAASAFAKTGKALEKVVDISGTEKVTPMIINDCREAPKDSFMQKLKSDWSKVEADTKSGAKKLEKKL